MSFKHLLNEAERLLLIYQRLSSYDHSSPDDDDLHALIYRLGKETHLCLSYLQESEQFDGFDNKVKADFLKTSIPNTDFLDHTLANRLQTAMSDLVTLKKQILTHMQPHIITQEDFSLDQSLKQSYLDFQNSCQQYLDSNEVYLKIGRLRDNDYLIEHVLQEEFIARRLIHRIDNLLGFFFQHKMIFNRTGILNILEDNTITQQLFQKLEPFSDAILSMQKCEQMRQELFDLVTLANSKQKSKEQIKPSKPKPSNLGEQVTQLLDFYQSLTSTIEEQGEYHSDNCNSEVLYRLINESSLILLYLKTPEITDILSSYNKSDLLNLDIPEIQDSQFYDANKLKEAMLQLISLKQEVFDYSQDRMLIPQDFHLDNEVTTKYLSFRKKYEIHTHSSEISFSLQGLQNIDHTLLFEEEYILRGHILSKEDIFSFICEKEIVFDFSATIKTLKAYTLSLQIIQQLPPVPGQAQALLEHEQFRKEMLGLIELIVSKKAAK